MFVVMFIGMVVHVVMVHMGLMPITPVHQTFFLLFGFHIAKTVALYAPLIFCQPLNLFQITTSLLIIAPVLHCIEVVLVDLIHVIVDISICFPLIVLSPWWNNILLVVLVVLKSTC